MREREKEHSFTHFTLPFSSLSPPFLLLPPFPLLVVLRLYKSLEFAVDFENALCERNPILRVLSAADSGSKCFRMLFDNIHWAIKIGLLPSLDEKRFGRLANAFWLTGLFAAIGKNYVLYTSALKKEARARKDQQVCSGGGAVREEMMG